MRILLTTAIVCAIQVNCNTNDEDTRIMARAYPKQKKIPFHRSIQIMNAQKFLRSLPNAKYKQNYKKRTNQKQMDSYTVFPSIHLTDKRASFPESPYFPIDALFNQKPNRIIKKMLPDYGLLHLSRHKRSANLANVSKLNTGNETTRHGNGRRKERKGESKVKTNLKKSNSKQTRHRIIKNKPTRGLINNANANNKRKQSANNKHVQASKIIKIKNIRTKRPPAKKNITGNKSAKVNKKTVRHVPSRGKENKKSRPQRQSVNKKRNNKRIVEGAKAIQNLKVNPSRRLIAAKDAAIEDYPYVVSIQKGQEHWCAGALLNPRVVITTANCVWKSDQLSRMRVRAGSRYVDQGGQKARIQELMRHPGWSIRHNPDNDVALLLLDRNIRFSNKVHGVDLPNRGMLPAFGDAWVTSWGSDRRDGMFQDRLTLQVYHARVMDHEKCNNITQRFGVYVTHNFFCMSQYGRRAPCTRDTGAPAVSDGVLWGLASWGLRKLCGTERFPAMFTYIASESIMNFIENTTRILMSDQRVYPFMDRIRDYRVKALMTNMSAAG
ncbi:uncharacterized protein [Battus philenor]|uniref:uncharacterized protein n=1 Tax=Battus philenor TaxID=42288 RepID=UPI0035CFED77